jgi:UDP-3-O-[3-hydroxymyristoyl] glucosamine N-acyltransferase
VAEVAAQLGGRILSGDPSAPIDHIAGIESAGPGALSFLSNRRYARFLARSQSTAVLVDASVPAADDGPARIQVDDPYAALARALQWMYPRPRPAPGLHPQAVVAEDAIVDGACIGALAVVATGAVIGPGTVVESGAVIGAHASVGIDGHIMANAVVAPGCVLGDRVVLNPGAVVGGDGYGFAPTPGGHLKIPQLGQVRLGDEVEVGANSCIDRSALPGTATVVGDGSKLDNLVQVGHGATLGRGVRMVAFSGVAGSTTLGDGVTLAAKAAVLGHREIGDHVAVGAASVVHDAQPAGARVSGVPAIDHRTWLRAAVAFRDLPELLTELRDLRRRVKALEEARDHE